MSEISKIQYYKDIYDIKDAAGRGTSYFGYCQTVAGTATKVVTLNYLGDEYSILPSSGFKLQTGTRLLVMFTQGNTAENPKLQIGDGGTEIDIIMHPAGIDVTENINKDSTHFDYVWQAMQLVEFYYFECPNIAEGGYWLLLNRGYADANVYTYRGIDNMDSFLNVDKGIWIGNNLSISSADYHDAILITGNNDEGLSNDFGETEGVISIGNNHTSIGKNSVSIGSNISAVKEYGIAIGEGTSANQDSLAIGRNTSTTDYAIAIGQNSNASYEYAIAAGYYASSSNSGSIAIGYYATAQSGISIGRSSSCSGSSAGVALGNLAVNTGSAGVAIGNSSSSSNSYPVAIGYSSTASGNQSVSLGYSAQALGEDSISILGKTGINNSEIAIGQSSQATEQCAIAIGSIAEATKDFDLSIGYYAVANAAYNVAVGAYSSVKSGQYATALGYYTEGSGQGSTALGSGASVTASYGTAVGYSSSVNGEYGVALGAGARADNTRSVSIGYNTSSGNYGVAIGQATAGAGSVVIGCDSDGNWNGGAGPNSVIIGGNFSSTSNHSNTISIGANYLDVELGSGNTFLGTQYVNTNTGQRYATTYCFLGPVWGATITQSSYACTLLHGAYHYLTQGASYGFIANGYGNVLQAASAGAIINGSQNYVYANYSSVINGQYCLTQATNSIANGYCAYTYSQGGAGSSLGYYTISNSRGMAAVGTCNAYENGTNENVTGTANVLMVGDGYSSTERSNALRVAGHDGVYSNYSFNSSGADYAEFIKPWEDGNPDNEDRVGYFVTVKDDYLVKANEGDIIAGITSGNPSIVGNGDEEYYWRWKRDEFDRFVYEEVEIFEEDSSIDEETGKIVDKMGNMEYTIEDRKVGTPEDGNIEIEPNSEDDNIEAEDGNIEMGQEEDITGIVIKKQVQSANYDPDLAASYVPRKERSEWDYVGMLGVLPVRDDGTCEVGKLCKCGLEGIATFAEIRSYDTYLVTERVTENIIKILLK